MKKLFLILSILLTFGISSCNRDNGPGAIPKKELQKALDLLAKGKMEEYTSKLDFGEELDSIHQHYFSEAIVQRQKITERTMGMVNGYKVKDAKMHGDTVATVYYTQYFANGDSILCSQKMVCIDGIWRLRMRN